MRKGTLARRYAKALLEIGREDGSYAKYGAELNELAGAFRAEPVLYKVLSNPMYKIEERKALADKLSEAVGASAVTKKFFTVLLERGNVRFIEGVAEAYAGMEDEVSGRIRVLIEAPSEPGGDVLNSVKEKLKKETGKEVIISFKHRPDLIGGMLVRVGNTILDGSVKSQLEKMREKLLEGAV